MFDFLQAVKFLKSFAKISFCILLLNGCDKLNSPKSVQEKYKQTQAQPDVLTRAIYSGLFQLDPQKVKASADAAPLRDLLVGLTQFNNKGEIIAGVAQNWFSEDQKEWLFILNENAKWSNGEPVTAQDFVASWQRLISPENPTLLGRYLIHMDIENAKAVQTGEKTVSELAVTALNDHSLQIRLNRPNALLPKMLAHSSLLPTYKGLEPTEQTFVSNGAYRLEQLQSKKMVLKANSAELPFQTVEYELISTIQNYTKFDIVENPLLSQKTNIIKFPRLCSYYYDFNFNDPELRKKEIRQAIRAMIAPAHIGENFGVPSQSVIPYKLAKVRERNFRPIIVESLLTQAGISSEKPLKLELMYDDGSQHSEIANQITRTLSQSDLFRIYPRVVEWSALQSFRLKRDYQLIRSGWCADYEDPLIFIQKYHSASPDNTSNYKNDMVDAKINRLQQEVLSLEERNQLIQEVSELLYEDVAALPLFQYQHRVGVAPSILGIEPGNYSEVLYSKDLKRMTLAEQMQTKDNTSQKQNDRQKNQTEDQVK